MTPVPHPHTRADGSVVWRVRFRTGTGQAVESFEDVRAAQDFARLVEQVGGTVARQARDAQVAGGGHIPTVRQALESYLVHAGAHTTPGTVADYRRMAERTWLPRFGVLPVTAMTRDAVSAWLADMRTTETLASRRDPTTPPEFVSAKSIKNAHSLLSSVLQHQVEDGTLPGNPARGIRLPTDRQQTREPVFLTRGQVAALVAACPPAQQPFVAFLAGTGLRWGEATALTVGDVDLDGPIPLVRVTKAWKKGARGFYLGSPKSRAGRRSVSLPASLVAELRPLVERRPRETLLFPGRGGAPMSSRWFHVRVWAPAIAAAGLGVRPRVHDLRHTHASMLIAEGVPVPMIQRRLGHENITTTVGTYGHLAPDAAALMADAIDRALATSLPQIEA